MKRDDANSLRFPFKMIYYKKGIFIEPEVINQYPIVAQIEGYKETMVYPKEQQNLYDTLQSFSYPLDNPKNKITGKMNDSYLIFLFFNTKSSAIY
ncbi:hypothetical protein ES705_31560 [subsurface metagenome]